MIENMDTTQWPIWAVLLLLILNIFKTPLGNLLPAILSLFNAKAISKAQIKEIEAEGHRQDEVAEKLMLASFAQQSLDHNRELIDFLKTVVVNRMDAMNSRMDAMAKRLEDIANDYRTMQEELRHIGRKEDN